MSEYTKKLICKICEKEINSIEYLARFNDYQNELCFDCLTDYIKKEPILFELIDNMNKIQLEKNEKYRNSWKNCNINILRKSLLHHTYRIMDTSLTNEQCLRELIHILNYDFFIYCRIKEQVSNNNDLRQLLLIK